MLKSAAFLAFLILMLFATSGCATLAVWRWACDDRVGPRQVTGVIVPQSGDKRFIVVAYGPAERESTLLVPIDKNDKPEPPYEYLDGKNNDEFWQNLTGEQYAWEVYYHPTIRLGTVVPTIKPIESKTPPESFWISEKAVSAIGYRINSANQITFVPILDARHDPANCHILLVPSSYPRLDNSRAPVAILATPFTFALDAVVTPIVLPIAILFVLGTHGGAI